MLINVVWDLTPCNLIEKPQGFGGSFRIAICRVGNKCYFTTMKMEGTAFFEILVTFYHTIRCTFEKRYVSLIYFVWISKHSDSKVRLECYFPKCCIDPNALFITPPPPTHTHQGHKHQMSLFNFVFLSLPFFYSRLSFFVSFFIHTAGQIVNKVYSSSF
jgi:hypothetical protein